MRAEPFQRKQQQQQQLQHSHRWLNDVIDIKRCQRGTLRNYYCSVRLALSFNLNPAQITGH